ncbi:MAG: hypothetical protein GKS07_07645 [Nitrosopumilus sp.]|nr:MAG: hypothetical protein GKS07_07645 [Nitrosopumilus sp.]
MKNKVLIILLVLGVSSAMFMTNAYGEKQSYSLEFVGKLSDTPTLHVYGESASEQHYPFVQFTEGQLDWLDRVVNEKAILMSESDISQYLELIGHDEIKAKYIADDRTIKYYALRLSDPGLNLEEHNVRAFYQYFPPAHFTKVNIDDDKIPQYLRHILVENDWTTLTDKQYLDLKEHMKQNDRYYQINEENHAPNYWQITYIGPDLKEVQDGLFKNRKTDLIEVSKSMFDIKKSETPCVPVESNNAANDVISYYNRFSITDSTGNEIRRVSEEDSITVQFNPYNDWAERNPFVFEFGIRYFDGNQYFTIYSDRNTISESLCDVTQGYQWEFAFQAGSYEVFIDRVNSGDRQDYDRRINVDKYKIYNALDEEPDFLDRMMSTPSFAETIYKITSVGSGSIGVNIEEVEWSPDGSFILFKQHERCNYIDGPQCVSKSLWKMDLTNSSLQKIPLHMFERYGNADEIKVSPDGDFLAMRGYYAEQDGTEHAGLFVYDFENNKSEKIIDRTQVHVTSFDWMPDGTILYHESITQNAGVLWNIDRDGNVLEKTYEGEPNFGYMDVSPDGTKVSYRAFEKEPGRSPPPGPGDFDPPGTITWFDIPTKEFFEEKITYNIYATTRWSPDNEHIYYLGIRPSPSIIGKLDVNSGEDTTIVTSDKQLDVSSIFSLNPEGNLMAFSMHHDMTYEYDSVLVMDVQNPARFMVEPSQSSIDGLECGFGRVLFNEQCISKRLAEQQGCDIVDATCVTSAEGEPTCGPNAKMSNGVCVIVDGGCEPDINGNTTWCGPQYDYLKIILSEPSAFMFVFGIPTLIAGIIITVIVVWRKRK